MMSGSLQHKLVIYSQKKMRVFAAGSSCVLFKLKSPFGVASRRLNHIRFFSTFDNPPKHAQMFLQFQCTHADCSQPDEASRMVRKFISKLAYEKGVVLVRCNCDKNHLIADRLVRVDTFSSKTNI